MPTMTLDECREFLLDKIRPAKLATVRKDGRPHVVPVWFDLDDDTLVFTTDRNSVKAGNMRRDPRVCLCVDDEAPPFAYVQIEGTAAMSSDGSELRRWATRIGGKYMGKELAEAYGERNSVEGELLVRVTPTKMIGQRDVAALTGGSWLPKTP